MVRKISQVRVDLGKETSQEANKKETYEKLGVEIDVKACIAVIDFQGRQYICS